MCGGEFIRSWGGKTTVVIRESNCAYKILLNNMTVGVVEETGYKVK